MKRFLKLTLFFVGLFLFLLYGTFQFQVSQAPQDPAWMKFMLTLDIPKSPKLKTHPTQTVAWGEEQFKSKETTPQALPALGIRPSSEPMRWIFETLFPSPHRFKEGQPDIFSL